MAIEVKVPDIGDFKDVPIIEIHVKPGDAIKADDPLDHARERQGDDGRAGRRRTARSRALLVKLGDKVSRAARSLAEARPTARRAG